MIKLYLKEDLTFDKIIGSEVVAVGTKNLKLLVYAPKQIDCDLLFLRPDGLRIGPITRTREYSVDQYRVNEFLLSELIFRKAGEIQCSIRITKDGTTFPAYFTFNNKYAVPEFNINKNDTDAIALQLEVTNVSLEATNKGLEGVASKVNSFGIEEAYDTETNGINLIFNLGGEADD